MFWNRRLPRPSATRTIHRRSRPNATAIALTALAAVLALPLPASAQSQAELRRENQRLQTRVRELEAELDAARTRLAELEKLVGELREAARGAPGTPARSVPLPPPTEPPVSIDETTPAASPRALRRAVEQRYAEHFGGTPVGPDGSGDRLQYLKEVRAWAAQINRELKAPIEWPVRLQQVLGVDRGHVVELQFVDPVTGTELGLPFLVHLPSAASRRLETMYERGELDQVLEVHGILVPEVRFNRTRMAPGPFDNPPLIGPFAEFGFRIDARTLSPYEPDAPDPPSPGD